MLIRAAAATAHTRMIPIDIAPVHAHAARSAVVTIKDIDFHPRRAVITRGGTVTWRFVDPEVTHNVTSTGRPRFRSSPDKKTGSYRVRFTRRGTYTYVCTLHLNMRGRVVVR